MSRRHVEEPYDLDDAEEWWAECMVVARALSAELRPKKMNYEIHGKTVPHLHLHLFPRADDDPFVGRPIDGTAHLVTRSPGELARLHDVIATAARRHGVASADVP
jgi:diadenosine tetraphosphate (Ap4A) HIT family hydrolase